MQHAAPLTPSALVADALELADLARPHWAPVDAPFLNDYTDVITRSDVDARIPEDVSDAMLSSLTAQSTVLQTFTRVPVAGAQTRFPVLAALPSVQWVNGETGLKQTTDVAWANKYLNIEELAVIVPIPEATLDDTSFDVWGSIQPLMEAAACRQLDQTVFFGTNAPDSFPTNIAASAIALGNTVTRGTNTVAGGGLSQDFSDLLSKLELQGFDADALALNKAYKGRLRSVRATDGQSLRDEVSPTSVHGIAPTYPMSKLWPISGSGAVEGIVYDPTEFVVGLRQDFTYKILDQAVLQDNTGAITLNLAQQDMVAMRMVMRVGWQCSNRINYDEPVESQRYPAAVIRQA